MAKTKGLSFRRKSIPLTALLLVGAFAAGSATFLAVRDSVTPDPDPQQEYRLELPSPAGSSVTTPDDREQTPLPDETDPPGGGEPEQSPELVAVDPAAPATQRPPASSDKEEGDGGAVSASASGDTRVSQLYVKPVDGAISKPWSNGELVYSETLGDYRVHCGVDIAASVGTKVRAMADGVVADIYDDDLLGRVVEITHADGTVSRYCNLQQAGISGVKTGAAVKMGDVIGGVGETALGESAEQSHLHLEVEKKGLLFDPQQLFE